jgi:hypothetical protein
MNNYVKIKTINHEISNLASAFRVLEKIKTNKLLENYKIVHRIYIGKPHELKITLWRKF